MTWPDFQVKAKVGDYADRGTYLHAGWEGGSKAGAASMRKKAADKADEVEDTSWGPCYQAIMDLPLDPEGGE